MKVLDIKIETKLLMLVASIVIVSFSSCKKDFGDINKSWDAKVYEPSIPALFNGIVASLEQPGGTGNILTSWVYQNSQLAGMYAASGYRMDNFAGVYWNNYYNALANARKLEELIAATDDPSTMTNVLAMLKTVMAYKTLHTTLIYGDMPYSDGGKAFSSPDFYRPKYDAQQEIIKAVLADLKWAIESLSTDSKQVALGGGDVLFANDISKWIKFANSLRLRCALSIVQKDDGTAKTAITEALAKPLLAADEVVGLFPASIPNLVIDRRGWYQGNSYIRMGSTMWHAMSTTDAIDGSGIYDLRCKIFFEPNKAGEWKPYPQVSTTGTAAEIGNSAGNDPYDEARTNNWVVSGNYLYAPLNFYYVADKTFPQLLITGAEISFLKAEIYNQAIGAAANPALAKSNYEAGITESVKFWYKLANASSIWVVNKPEAAPTAEELTAMLTHSEVAYSSTASTALQQIYKQHWIALFHQPFDAWTLARRTSYATPSVTLASDNAAFNLFKLIYPQSEIDGNYANWSAVTGGTDSQTKKPWFMK